MIVSHRHEFVFIKLRKVAGSSVELALSTVCGPSDIITGGANASMQGAKGPQNHELPILDLTPRQWASWVRRRKRDKMDFHIGATDVRRIIGEDRWSRYFTFAIERNPWDKAVSRYFWERSRREVPDFSTFIREAPDWMMTSFDQYTDRGEIIVDRVLRFEHLADEFADLWAQALGGAPPDLPRENSTSRPSRSRDWRAMYSDGDAEVVASRCWREIDGLGYEFQ